MNEFFLIKKEKLKSFLASVMKNFCLISPQAARGGDFLFQATKDLDRIDLNYDITSNTIKEFFFPARETIFTYEKKVNGSPKITVAEEQIKRQTIFFGLRSCDVRAVNFCDRFFAQEPRDNLYWQKRDKGILISLACNKPPRKSCFCVYTQSGPFLEADQGFDLQLVDLGKKYLVEVGTEKGESLIFKYRRFFTKAEHKSIRQKLLLEESCRQEFSQQYNLLSIHEKLKKENLHSLWEELGKRCTNCAGCEFICPTCFCFYTQDIGYSKTKGERIRAWDSCTFSGYSRMAGDINPHAKNSERIARRFFCKLYNCYNWFGIFACTGCGRCSYVCPVNLDMESFIASLMQKEAYLPLLKEL